MPIECQAARRVLDCAGVGIEVVSTDAAVVDFVVEYFEPWFRSTQRNAAWTVTVANTAAAYAEMQQCLPAHAVPRPCFAHDQEVLSLPAWSAGGVVNVSDAERSCFLRLRSGRVDLIADPRTRRWRFTLLWIVQEIAATYLRRTHVDLHAAAVESAGRALVIAGPKNAGKTTLSFYLMRSPGWGSIANDRTFVGGEAAAFVAAGMPTAVKIRPPMLARFPQLRLGLPPVARPYLYTLAELATAGPSEEPVEAVDFALTPNQIARRLGAETQASAPLGAIVFPSVCDDGATWSVDPLTTADTIAAIHGNLYGAAGGERPMTFFEELTGGQCPPSPPLVAAIAAGTSGYHLRLGRDAYAGAALSNQLRQLLS